MMQRLVSLGVFLFFALHVVLAGVIVHLGGEAGRDFARLVFYPLIFVGTGLSLVAYLKLARSTADGNNSLILALNVYVEMAWLLLVGVLLTIVTRGVFGYTRVIPDYVIYGLIAGVASVILLRGLILVLGAFAKAGWLSYPIRLWPFGRRRR